MHDVSRTPRLPDTLRAWDTAGFAQTLKAEIRTLGGNALRLQQGVAQGGIVDDSDIETTVLSARDAGNHLETRVGVFFTEVVGGCSCGDEPMRANVYCVLQIDIDKSSAEATVRLLQD